MASVAVVLGVVGVALTLGPIGLRWWLLVFAVLAVAMAISGVLSEPRDLTPALLFSLAPVVALLPDDQATWAVAPLAALLLIAAELNALSWDADGLRGDGAVSRRLTQAGQLAGVGIVSSWGVAATARATWLGGTAAVFVAAVAVGGFGFIVFGRMQRVVQVERPEAP
jgi:hypothetical protein